MRLGPTAFPITPPIQFSEFPARNTKRQNLQEFGSKAVWRLEITNFARGVDSPGDGKERQYSVGQRLFFLKKSWPRFFQGLQELRKTLEHAGVISPGKPVSQDVFHTKAVTRFPYLNHKKQPQTSIRLSLPSFSEISLPQLLLSDGNELRCSTARADGLMV